MLEVDSREAAQTAVAMQLGVGVGAESEMPRDARLVAVPIIGAATALTESLVCLASRRSTRLVSAVYEAAASGPTLAGPGPDDERSAGHTDRAARVSALYVGAEE